MATITDEVVVAPVGYAPPVFVIVARAVQITAASTVLLAGLVWEWLRHSRSSRVTREMALARCVTSGLVKLGPTFVKVGQMVGSRRDLLPDHVCDALGTLHDDVPVMTDREFKRAWRMATESGLNNLAKIRITGRVLGCGSIACVYEGEVPGGTKVAVKLRRPGLRNKMGAELALLYGFVRLMQRLPAAAGAPMAELVDYMNSAIYGQLDLRLEASHTEQLRLNLAVLPEIVVPAVWRSFSNEHAITFEYIPELGRCEPLAGESHASTLLNAAWRMIFGDGFVHCDLHPGNVYPLSDGRTVILDAGYCVELPWEVQDNLSSFFAALARGDGQRCGEIMADAGAPPPTGERRDEFVSEIAMHVHRYVQPGTRFDMTVFGSGISEFQNRHKVHPSADFAFPLMSLMVLEGTARGLDPQADITSVGR